MEIVNVNIKKTNILDIVCINNKILELEALFNNHNHTLSDIVDFPIVGTNNVGKVLSVNSSNQVVWINNPGIPEYVGNANKYLYTDGNTVFWKTKPQVDWTETDNTSEAFIKNKPTQFNPAPHNHDDRYYTEQEINDLLAAIILDLNNHIADTNNPHNVTKAQVGLGNVDNTSDLDKPISTATQTALDNKSNVGHTHPISDVVNLQTELDNKSNVGHIHDDRYYTESEIDALLANIGGVEQYDTFAQLPATGNPNKLYVTRNENNRAYYWNTTVSAYRKLGAYLNNFVVSLSGGKRFLKWDSGQTVPAAGKTAEEILLEGAVEAINPTLTLTRTSAQPEFNQTSISNVISYTRVINSLGASVATASLEYWNGSAWVVLSTDTNNGSFTHNLTVANFFLGSWQYRYIVVDTAGGTTTTTLTVTPKAYVAPSISFSALAGSLVSPESHTVRERGNTSSTLQGSTTRNSPLVNISSYQFSVSVNGGGYTNVGSSVSLAAAGGSFTNTPDTTNSATSTTVTYRVVVTDAYTTTQATYTITYKYIMFFGDVDVSLPLNSSTIRSLQRRFWDAGSPFTFNTGTTNRRFIVAMDSARGLTQALDTNNNVDLTSVFVNNVFNVNDAGGNATSYNNYVFTNAIPYNPQITIRITYI